MDRTYSMDGLNAVRTIRDEGPEWVKQNEDVATKALHLPCAELTNAVVTSLNHTKSLKDIPLSASTKPIPAVHGQNPLMAFSIYETGHEASSPRFYFALNRKGKEFVWTYGITFDVPATVSSKTRKTRWNDTISYILSHLNATLKTEKDKTASDTWVNAPTLTFFRNETSDHWTTDCFDAVLTVKFLGIASLFLIFRDWRIG